MIQSSAIPRAVQSWTRTTALFDCLNDLLVFLLKKFIDALAALDQERTNVVQAFGSSTGCWNSSSLAGKTLPNLLFLGGSSLAFHFNHGCAHAAVDCLITLCNHSRMPMVQLCSLLAILEVSRTLTWHSSIKFTKVALPGFPVFSLLRKMMLRCFLNPYGHLSLCVIFVAT